MITIKDYMKSTWDDMGVPFSQYFIDIEIEDMEIESYPVPVKECETLGFWDESKTQAYLNSKEAIILQVAQSQSLEITKKILVAKDFKIESPPMPIDANDAWTKLDTTMKGEQKSLGLSVQALYKLIEDLRNRINVLEKAK